jgi:RHS repeat-associated protein
MRALSDTVELDKVTDTAGNTMTFSYISAGLGSVVPNTVSWTPSSYGATTYNYTMQFAYGTNSTTSSYYGYVGGTEVTNTDLLQSITINYAGTTVKKYALTYQASPTTGAEELTQLQECADAAQTNCLAPTTFGYQAPPVGTTSTATSAISNAASLVWNYDFNGDGQNDLAYCSPSPGSQVWVAFASPSGGYSAPINTGISCAGSTPALYGDFLGNGQAGILAVSGSNWYYYQWNGNSFVGQSTGVAYDTAAIQFVAADVNGDGRPDLVELTEGTSFTVSVRLNTSAASAVSFSSTNTVWYSATVPAGTIGEYAELQSGSNGLSGILQAGNVKRLDFNGDGRDDLALETQTMYCVMFRQTCIDHYIDQTHELISTGSSFSDTLIQSASTMTVPAIAFLNFNSDACTDYLSGGSIYVSGCNGTSPSTVSLPSNVVGVMDWNADGRGDILVNNGGTIGVYESTGTGLSGLISTSIPYSSSYIYFGFDQGGNGLDALGAWEAYSTPYNVSYYSHNGAGLPPDLVTSITDGYGNFAKPAYVSLARAPASTYTPGSSSAPSCSPDANDCYQNYNGSTYVVSQVTYSDPSNQPNGTYTQTFAYSDAMMSIDGRGFGGFESQKVTDSRNNVAVNQTYAISFPYTLMPGTRTVTNLTTGNIVSTTVDSVTFTELSSTPGAQRWFPYVSNATEKEYEVGGTENGQLITTDLVSYSYDNYGNATSIQKTVTDNDPSSPYVGDSWTITTTNTPSVSLSSWCLDLLSESQIAYTASNGSPSVTRTRQLTPDASHCRYTQIVTEPSSSSYEVTEALGYDSFGNINNDTITGINMAARTTSANWGTTGQFPMSVTDATGIATTQFNYNFSYGLVSSEADPNSTTTNPITTSWQYDAFGRLSQETRPDKIYTTWQYNSCTNYGGCLMGANTLALAHFVYNADGSLETDGTTYFDELERPILSNSMVLSGSWNQNEVRYDSLGRVVKRAAPCAWTGATTNACPYWTTTAYDILNRPTQIQRPINQNDSVLQTTSFAYEGRTVTMTDPNGHARTLVHDVNGWLRQTKDAVGYTITLGYDAAGAKSSVTDNLGNTLWTGTYAYGIAPLLVGETDADRGAWGYTVDALGERTAWTDAKGQHFYESYDALSRPLTRTEPDLFTQWTWGSSVTNHNIGKLANVCTGSGSACSSSYYSEGEAYDSLGRLYQRAIAIPSMGTYTYTWQYNATTGLLDTLTYPISTSGQALNLKYSYQNGILQAITDTLDSPNVTVWQADAQNPAGQITQETLGNSLVTTRAYDAVTRWLSSVQSGPGGGATVQNQSFLYDEVGNVTQRQDNNLGLSENFYYDADNRLSYSTLNGTQNLSLSYNGMGNITSRTDVAGGTSWTYDPVHFHEVTQAGSTAFKYAYDANGNVTSRQGSSIIWSSYNYPTLINDTATGESVSFVRGPDRQPWFEQTKGPSGTETAYRIGGLMDIVTAGGATVTRDYIYAGGEPVAVDVPGTGPAGLHYFQPDQEGSISAITNSSGQVSVNESFSAFGNRRNPATWSGAPTAAQLTTIAGITRYGYTFQDVLGSQMGLNNMVGRVQDAITGRFLSADPYIPDPTDPQSYNSYSYTRNNPLTYTDPSGFDDDCVAGACIGGSPDPNPPDSNPPDSNPPDSNPPDAAPGAVPAPRTDHVRGLLPSTSALAPTHRRGADGRTTADHEPAARESEAGSALPQAHERQHGQPKCSDDRNAAGTRSERILGLPVLAMERRAGRSMGLQVCWSHRSPGCL